MAAERSGAMLPARDQGVVFLISGAHGITHWIYISVIILLPEIRTEFSLDYTWVGTFISVFYVFTALTNIVAGPIGDMTGRRVLLQGLALFFISVGAFLLSISVNYWMAWGAAILIAMSTHFWHPGAIPYLTTRYENSRGYVMSIHSLLANIGDSVGPFLTGLLVSGAILGYSFGWTWRDVAMMLSVPGLLILPFIIYFVGIRGAPEARKRDAGMDLRSYVSGVMTQFKDRVVLGIAVITGLRSAAQGGIRNFLPFYVVDVMGLDLAYGGFLLMIMSLGGTVAAVPAGLASDRYGRRRIAMLALSFTIASVILLTFIRSETALVFMVAVLGLSMFGLRPVMMSWMMDVMPPKFRGSGTNFMFTVQSGCSAVMPLVAGIIADAYGLAAVFYVIAGVFLVANCLVYLLPDDKAPNDPADKVGV